MFRAFLLLESEPPSVKFKVAYTKFYCWIEMDLSVSISSSTLTSFPVSFEKK